MARPLAEDALPDCKACSYPFAAPSTTAQPIPGTASVTGRYECPKCHNHFCLDCDAFIHEVLTVCVSRLDGFSLV